MPAKTLTVRSAGGVVMRDAGDSSEPEALLIATHGATRWALPKGRIEPGETGVQAAVREVAEETGIEGQVIAEIETIEYWFYARRHLRHHKFVEYYLMAYRSGEPHAQEREVDDVRWVPVTEALTLLSYPNDRKVLQNAVELWRRNS